MKLNEMAESITMLGVTGDLQVEVQGVFYDSGKVKPGGLFVAVPGAHADGAEYISDALSNGAVAVVSENALDLGHGAVHIQVHRARRALAELANAFHGDLSHQLKI